MKHTKAYGRTWQLVVSDMDGTLLDEQSQISAENIKAIQQLRQQSIGFTLATGRMDRMMRTYTDILDIDMPVIACNGAVIRDVRTNSILWHKTIQTDHAVRVASWLQREGFDYLCYTPDLVYYPSHSKRIWHFERYNEMAKKMGCEPVQLLTLEGREDKAFGDLIKILAAPQTPDQLSAVEQYVKTIPALEGVSSMADAYDIMAAGVSKGDALARLAEMLHIDLSNIAVVGDNDNDIPMMREAGLAIAMANGTPEARAAGDFVTTRSHDQSGLAQAVADHILHKK